MSTFVLLSELLLTSTKLIDISVSHIRSWVGNTSGVIQFGHNVSPSFEGRSQFEVFIVDDGDCPWVDDSLTGNLELSSSERNIDRGYCGSWKVSCLTKELHHTSFTTVTTSPSFFNSIGESGKLNLKEVGAGATAR